MLQDCQDSGQSPKALYSRRQDGDPRHMFKQIQKQINLKCRCITFGQVRIPCFNPIEMACGIDIKRLSFEKIPE